MKHKSIRTLSRMAALARGQEDLQRLLVGHHQPQRRQFLRGQEVVELQRDLGVPESGRLAGHNPGLHRTGKRDPRRLRSFLSRRAPSMPRTALRYAIERFPAAERKKWLSLPRGARP